MTNATKFLVGVFMAFMAGVALLVSLGFSKYQENQAIAEREAAATAEAEKVAAVRREAMGQGTMIDAGHMTPEEQADLDKRAEALMRIPGLHRHGAAPPERARDRDPEPLPRVDAARLGGGVRLVSDGGAAADVERNIW